MTASCANSIDNKFKSDNVKMTDINYCYSEFINVEYNYYLSAAEYKIMIKSVLIGLDFKKYSENATTIMPVHL